MDRQRFDADPDPTFHFYANPDPQPDPDPHVGKSEFFLETAEPFFFVLYFNFQISVIGSHCSIFWKVY